MGGWIWFVIGDTQKPIKRYPFKISFIKSDKQKYNRSKGRCQRSVLFHQTDTVVWDKKVFQEYLVHSEQVFPSDVLLFQTDLPTPTGVYQ